MRTYPLALVSCAALLMLQLGCAAAASETVEGPESPELVATLDGSILIDEAGRILSVSLPDQSSHVVYEPPSTADGMGPTVHSLSGPDQEGRIAYVLDHYFVEDKKDRRHQLKTIRVDGTGDAELFSRPGSAMWATSAAGKGEIGHHVALSPTGARIALISRTFGRQMTGALLTLGQVEIWNAVEKAQEDAEVVALDEPMSWFPDGKKLAYAALVKRDELPADAPGLDRFGVYFGEIWDEIPAIFVYDLETKASRFVHVGWRPVVAPDGQSLLIAGWQDETYSLMRFDLASGTSSPITVPGIVGDVIGISRDNLILYVGLPTTGATIEFTKNNSPLRGPKQVLTVKVVNEAGDQFATLVPAIDPRSQASFGPAK